MPKLCRYAKVLRKLNSIIPIGHNISFCEARSSVSSVKWVFMKLNFTKGKLDFVPQKLRL
jgi:hypothetical protein